MGTNAEFNGTVSLNADAKSPFWFASFIGADRRQRRRSTKVPVVGGLYKGERLTAAQAKKRALLVGMALAAEVHEEFRFQDNRSVREVCDAMLAGSKGGGRQPKGGHSKTFHSLRASVATLLQAAGVSQGIAMELVGHDSAAVHAVYVHPSLDLLREAACRLAVL